MDYWQEYQNIVTFRRKNPLPSNEYGENHHVKPRSLYPDLAKDPDNIVRLTASEHYKCHYYLVKMYEETGETKAYQKMVFALNQMSLRMVKGMTFTKDELECFSRIYEESKIHYSKVKSSTPVSEETRKKISAAGKGLKRTVETRQKISAGLKGKPKSEEARRRMSETRQGENAPWYGKSHTEEWKEKMSKTLKGHPVSEETKRKIAEARKKYWAEKRKAS